jgi:hypothetical protein
LNTTPLLRRLEAIGAPTAAERDLLTNLAMPRKPQATAAARKRPATPRLTKAQQIDYLVDLLGRVCAFLREDGYTRASRPSAAGGSTNHRGILPWRETMTPAFLPC